MDFTLSSLPPSENIDAKRAYHEFEKYFILWQYPIGASKREKAVIRKRAKNFHMVNAIKERMENNRL